MRYPILKKWENCFEIGIRYSNIKELDTSYYKEKTILNLESYNQMLLLKVSIRFDKGGYKPAEIQTNKKQMERER